MHYYSPRAYRNLRSNQPGFLMETKYLDQTERVHMFPPMIVMYTVGLKLISGQPVYAAYRPELV